MSEYIKILMHLAKIGTHVKKVHGIMEINMRFNVVALFWGD
jgi:hypothetical protein